MSLYAPSDVLIVCLPLVKDKHTQRYLTEEGCFAGRILFASNSNFGMACQVQYQIEPA
jgi:hypothetical protein